MNGLAAPPVPASAFLAAWDLGDYGFVVMASLACLTPAGFLAYILVNMLVLSPRHERRQARQRQERQQLMWSFAQSRGWSWQEETAEFNDRWPGAWFTQRHGLNAKNVLRGQFRGRPAIALDYSYWFSDNDGSGTQRDYSLCVLGLPGRSPEVLIVRRWGLGPLIAMVAPIGVWMSVPAFRRRFRVKAADRAYAREIITTDVQRMLGRRADVSLLIEGEDLMCWREGIQSTQEMLDRLNLLADVADAMPAVGAIRHQ